MYESSCQKGPSWTEVGRRANDRPVGIRSDRHSRPPSVPGQAIHLNALLTDLLCESEVPVGYIRLHGLHLHLVLHPGSRSSDAVHSLERHLDAQI